MTAQSALVTVYYSAPVPGDQAHWFADRSGPTQSPLDIDGGGGLFWWRSIASYMWLDANHVSPGFGYLHILAATYNGSHGSTQYDAIGNQPYDLRGGRFSFDVSTAYEYTLSKDTRLIFWLQTPEYTLNSGGFLTQLPTSPVVNSSTRYVNLGYVGTQTIDEALGYTPAYARSGPESRTTGWIHYVVEFDPAKPWQWVAYGSRADKTAIYALPTSLDATLSHWSWNLGIHAVYGQVAPPAYDPSTGHLRLRNLRLEVRPELNGL